MKLGDMNLQKFGVKLFLNMNNSFQPKDFIPVFHEWIQNKVVEDHLLIDVADYSHMKDGPGVMLIAHEGNFSLDQENLQPGILYMRKVIIKGSFSDRFNKVLLTTIKAAKFLLDNHKGINFINNSFRFIANDRLCAENTIDNQDLYKREIHKSLIRTYPNCELKFNDISGKNERLAFTVRFSDLYISLLYKS
jgi:hypothetical protein